MYITKRRYKMKKIVFLIAGIMAVALAGVSLFAQKSDHPAPVTVTLNPDAPCCPSKQGGVGCIPWGLFDCPRGNNNNNNDKGNIKGNRGGKGTKPYCGNAPAGTPVCDRVSSANQNCCIADKGDKSNNKGGAKKKGTHSVVKGPSPVGPQSTEPVKATAKSTR